MKSVKILVVDDERVVALDIRNTLERLGYTVPVVAVSGEEAVEKAREFSPNLVLMDVSLRGATDGIQAAKIIHKSLGIPVIYLTGHSDEDTMRRAMDAAPFGYLLKPFQERELHSTIEIALYKHREEKELIKAREVAEEEGMARSLFMANVSHEVRTALNGIVGMAELALDTDLTEEQRDYLETVLRSSDNLARVVNDVLDFSKIQSKRLKLTAKPFDLEEVLRRQVKAVEPSSRSKGLQLTWHIAPGVPRKLVGDSVRLGQVLANLLGNAVKFTNSGEVGAEVNLVEVSARREEALAPRFDPMAEVRLLFSVRDTGIGIPSGKQELVFETFQQATEDTSEKYGGAGLGLAICRELAEMMGGDIWLRSREGLGSTFYCTLGFNLQSVEGEGLVPQHVQLSLPPLKVLVVDDNVVSRKLAARLLEKRGHTSTCVADAETALEILGKKVSIWCSWT
jgi:two-component system, sensor histidine kinase